MKIAVVTIAYNEEEALTALRGTRVLLWGHMEYVVVADNGSTDRTRIVAQDQGAEVVDVEWKDDFSALRNDAQEAALRLHPDIDYFLHVDADEEWGDPLLRAVRQEVELRRPDIVFVPTRTLMNDYALRENYKITGAPWPDPYPDYHGRVLRKGLRWMGKLHEHVPVTPEMKVSRIDAFPMLNHHDIGTRFPHNWKRYEDRLKLPAEERTQP